MLKPTRTTAIVVIVTLSLLMLLLFLQWLHQTQRNWTRFEPDSFEPEGYQAVSLLLAKQQFHRRKLTRFNVASNRPLLVQTAGPVDSRLRAAVLNWVKAGGVLVELAEASPRFSPAPPIHLPVVASNVIAPRVSLLADLDYHIKSTAVWGVQNPEEGYFGINEKFLIARQSLGNGMILTWCDPLGLTNRSLKASPDNGVIFATLINHTLPPGTIDWYDLRNSAIDSGRPDSRPKLFSGWSTGWLIIGLAIGLTLWKLAARFGRARPLQIIRGRSYNEFVLFLAQLFRQAQAKSLVLENLWDAFLTTALTVTGLPPSTPPPVLLERIQTLTNRDYRSLLAVEPLLGQTRLELPQRQFITIAASLDASRKELEEWKKSKQN